MARNDNRDAMGQGKHYYVYIMTNPGQSTLYTGSTNDLKRRVSEHREKVRDGFTKQYNVVKLVYYEKLEGSTAAIKREKQIKAGSRKQKVELINSFNKEWDDLYDLI